MGNSCVKWWSMPPATSVMPCQSISDFIRLLVGQPAFCIILEGETGQAVAWCAYSSSALWMSAPAKIAFQFIPPYLYSSQSHLHSTSFKGWGGWQFISRKEPFIWSLVFNKINIYNKYSRVSNLNLHIPNNWVKVDFFSKVKLYFKVFIPIALNDCVWLVRRCWIFYKSNFL